MNKKEYDAGYQAAIEAIKQALQGGGNGSGGGAGQQASDLDPNMTPPPVPQNGNGSGKGSGNSKKDGQQQGGGDGSRTNPNDSSQGIVRPEDCLTPGNMSGVPNTPGGMVAHDTCDQIAEAEGYDKSGQSENSIENDWKDIAIEASKQMQGTGAGSLRSTIEGLYKTTKDWRKQFNKILGRALNKVEKRRALVNKNVLASRSEFRRTEKDKYDSMDYMMVWIDSSGSMSDTQLKMCLSEVYHIAVAKKPLKIVVVQCDTKIHQIKEYKGPEELKKDIVHQHVLGRGGTELKPCWDLLISDKRYNKINPDIVIIFTDGYLNQYPRSARHMEYLCWCFIDNPSCDVQYQDRYTSCVHLSSSDIK